mgnify:CR=1 FL=1
MRSHRIKSSIIDFIHHLCYGVCTMQRYQIYLEPESVGVLDELAKLTSFSRSQIIRDVISSMAKKYEKLLEVHTESQMKNNPLLKMAGFAKSGTPGLATRVNEIYLKD